ncbi:ribose-phosphate pyrophosphokinase [Patescibacteria group bacterium]|nr:ribose-phosphate pyrophosphokinase [Patescibacteria group bacterium]MBU1472886.1 ribose-phosphate pyrophosphokinase [Patescibacteria group bacterium]MBU2459787.1 ribose-phosphate pyrophosphokinase [Patescibacteria group bacterium]MBU2544808.1 ribose-phosphate pyrophosphokinase [Patescibacteria group bacterium]
MKDFLLFSGSSNKLLAQEIAKLLNKPLGKVDLTRFADGEIRPWIQEDVRRKIVFVIQSLSHPMDEHIMELTLMGDAIRRSAPETMVAVIPYMGYARQDKQHRTGEPVSARVIAKFIEISKYKEVITVDLHNDAIVGFFQIPVTHVSALQLLASEIKKLPGLSDKNSVVISPDVGGVKRARNLAYLLDMPMVVMEKKRHLDRFDTGESFQIIGDVKGKTAIIVDDIISTGGTIAQSAASLKDVGVSSVLVFATHAVLAGKALDTISRSSIDKVVCTNTIASRTQAIPPKLSFISIASLLADAIASVVSVK